MDQLPYGMDSMMFQHPAQQYGSFMYPQSQTGMLLQPDSF